MTKEERWIKKTEELENFFNQCKMPTEPVKISICETITDCNGFVKSHIIIVKNFINNRHFIPYMLRLIKLKEIIEKKDN
jgi:hypothetical protein